MQTHLRANHKTLTNTSCSTPKDKYKHILGQTKRKIQTHPRANQKTNTNTL